MENVEERAQRIARLEAQRGRPPVEDRALTRSTLPGVFFPQTGAGDAVSVRSALGLVDVFASVSVYARMFTLLPWHAYRKTGEGRVRLDDSLLGRLLRKPAPGVSPAAWRGHLGTTLAVAGEAFVGLYRDADARIVALGLLHPDRMEVALIDGAPLYTYTGEDGTRQYLAGRDVIHVRGPLSLDGLRGCSPIRYCREVFSTAKSIGEHAGQTWQSGAMPPGVLKVPAGPTADDLMANLDRAWHQRGRGRVAVLQGDIAFEAVGVNNSDSEFIASAAWSSQAVARAFGLPPWAIFTATSDSSLQYSTTEGQLKALVTHSLAAWFVAAEDAFSANAELCPGDLYCHVEVEGVMRPDHQARAEWYAKALDPERGWLTRAEVRALEDLPAESTPALEEVPDA
jgi:HK97 family phage portal protein